MVRMGQAGPFFRVGRALAAPGVRYTRAYPGRGRGVERRVAVARTDGRVAAPRLRRGPVVVAGAIVLYWLSLYLFVPVLAPQAHRLGAGVAGVGLVLASYGLVQFLLRIPVGIWSDRDGRRRPFFVAAVVASGAGALGMGVAHGPLALGVFRGVSGLAACGWVAITLLFAEFFPAERTAWAMGVVGFLATGAQLVGTFAGGFVAQAAGFRAPFLAAAGVAVAALVAAVATREPHAPGPARAMGLRQRLQVGRRRGVMVASGLSIASHYVTFTTVFGFVPLLASERFSAGGAALGVLALCSGVPSALVSLGSGRLAERWSAGRLTAAGFVLAAAATALLPLAPSLAALAGCVAVVGSGLGLIGPTLMTAAVRDVPAGGRGTAMGFYQSIYAIGMAGGPALAGWMGARLGMDGLFWTTAALAASAGVLCVPLLAEARTR